MFVILLLSVCLTAKAEEFTPLGRAIDLPNYNVMGMLKETGTQILRSQKVHTCSVVSKASISSQAFDFYKNTKSFYSSMTTTAGLDTSLQAGYSLGFTLDGVSKGIAGYERTVTGNALLILASTYQTRLNKDCIQNPAMLEPTFLSDFAKLPTVVQKPWLSSSWMQYNGFLKKYGSHVVTSITCGSSINQMAFADTSDSYSERDFQVKSCIKLAGPTEVGKLNVSMCAGIDQSEIKRVSGMSMSDDLVVRGGTPETRNQLIIKRTPELIERFMNEAKVTNSTIQYEFTSVWDLLQAVYVGIDQNSFIRAINLEYYYLGYLNYGCDYRESAGVVFQMFNFSRDATPSTPQYECTLAPKGCHSDNDCHYKPIWCSCKGSSCVSYHDVPLDTGNTKTVARANTDSDWGWQGCDWKPGLAGFKCICRHESHQRKLVWSPTSKDTMFLGMRRRMAVKEDKDAEEPKEEL